MTDTPLPAARLYDPRPCTLGEGPLWHPGRGQLFWFDILSRRLLTRRDDTMQEWTFDGYVSAAGWTGPDSLLIASETALSLFDLRSGEQEILQELEADNPLTRSNDGRADPWGGFWIGTMGKELEPGAGAIYRFYRGELRRIFDAITIPNAISFSPDGHWLYFTDTPTRLIYRQALRTADGWPTERDPEVFIDLRAEELNPDGAVVDAQGGLWSAQWGASRVARYDAQGAFDCAVRLPAQQTSCAAFGGADLSQLFVTSAQDGLDPNAPHEGRTFVTDLSASGFTGQAEHRVLI